MEVSRLDYAQFSRSVRAQPTMTNEDAFTRIKATESCFVVWSPALNEVVTVTPCKAGNQAPDVVLEAMTAGDGPKVGRFFISATVTMNTLRDQQTEIARTAQRVRILHTLPAWDTGATDRAAIETGVFPATFSARDDGELLIRNSTTRVSISCRHSNSPGSTRLRLKRPRARWATTLAAIWNAPSPSCVRIGAGSSTCGSRDCPERTRAVEQLDHRRWRPCAPPGRYYRDACKDGRNGMAVPIRFESMLALGNIGAPAGEPAETSIATHIYDSSEEVSAVRDQVLSRIRTPRTPGNRAECVSEAWSAG